MGLDKVGSKFVLMIPNHRVSSMTALIGRALETGAVLGRGRFSETVENAMSEWFSASGQRECSICRVIE